MTETRSSRSAGLPHAIFLQRVTDEPASSPEVRLGQGAFLALRFVDLLAPDREPVTSDVFRYQWAATERYCAELTGEGTEAAHLSGIVRATGEAHRRSDIRLLAPALLAYALYLEQESQLEEAEDVLQTLIQVSGNRLVVPDLIAAWMRLGRVRRLQTSFDAAVSAYAEAGRLANVASDRRSVLLSRIGRCNVIHFRGNLSEAEEAWRGVLADAATTDFRDVQAQAEHGLGNVLVKRGLSPAGAPHLWRAYELYEDSVSQCRALGDLGLALLSIGQVAAAELALQHVVRQGNAGSVELTTNAMIELMHCASFRRDRVGFERWRDQCLEAIEQMIPNIRADYYLKVGIGLARFGNSAKADTNVRRALEIATAHNLYELVFRIEQIQDGLRDCEALDKLEATPAEPVLNDDALRELSASLATLDA